MNKKKIKRLLKMLEKKEIGQFSKTKRKEDKKDLLKFRIALRTTEVKIEYKIPNGI